MHVLMLGWEFPPFIAGGVGVHCKNLTQELSSMGVKLTYILPKRSSNVFSDYMEIINVESKGLYVYDTVRHNEELRDNVSNFTFNVVNAVKDLNFDVIHCHEWVTFDAGLKLKELTGKPLIMSIHATEYDRTPHNPWSVIVDKEKKGLNNADMVITVSNMMKNTLMSKYFIPENKIKVIYNAINLKEFNKKYYYTKHNSSVLFVGRLFVQKGVDFFLRTARKVLDVRKDVDFIIIGTGDMMPQLIRESIDLGIHDNVYFTGFVNEEDKIKYYQSSDVFVMLSVSEPFGITALEAVASKTPLIVSKNSGCSEVISHCLKVDFWDIEKTADYILHVLSDEGLKSELVENAYRECSKLNWKSIAGETKKVYEDLL